MKNIVTSVILIASLFLSACVVVLDETPARQTYYTHQPYHNTYIVEQPRYCSTVYGYADVYRSHGTTIRHGQSRVQC